jgi:hypothetical protein
MFPRTAVPSDFKSGEIVAREEPMILIGNNSAALIFESTVAASPRQQSLSDSTSIQAHTAANYLTYSYSSLNHDSHIILGTPVRD